ncbi:hypothetical protein ACLKA6_009557 [Drosophila palustris]
MAVKQNNTEANEPDATSGGGSQASNGGSTVVGSSKSVKISTDEGGGAKLDTPTNQQQQQQQDNQLAIRGEVGNAMSLIQKEIKSLLNIMQGINPEDRHSTLLRYQLVIHGLANMQLTTTNTKDLILFKEEIVQVGNMLMLPNKKEYLMFYLSIVYQLISQSDNDTKPPSVAVAIVFKLFSDELIDEAVQSLLDQNVQDETIRKTVGLLCTWLRVCNFCSNLNSWIMALLRGLRRQEKYQLLDEIAMDNIDMLFNHMIFPALRHKVAPIVFHMLATINQAPQIFHKLLPRIPRVIETIKKQANNMDESSIESRRSIQKLVDLFNALMMRFYDNDDLYAPLKDVLQMYEPSRDCVALARAMLENALPRNARVGLVNLGNTCYMNSVLQALAMTSDFVRQILLIESNSLLLVKMQQQIALMHHSMRYELTPSRVLKATRPPGFTPGLQQDSSEFLGYLLDLLHEHEIGAHNAQQMLDTEGAQSKALKEGAKEPRNNEIVDEIVAAGVIPYNSKDYELCRSTVVVVPHAATPTNTTLPMPKKPPSTIDKTFAGKLSTTYKCLSCDWESRNEDSFRELQLSFPDNDCKDDCSAIGGASNYSVQDLIDYYCSPEKLDGDNQYFCPSCKKLCDAERRIAITQAPRNLILTLKQFKYDQKYHFRTKLMHKVFHDESVIVKVCAMDSLQETCMAHYDLYAGVVHAGYSMDSGHYFTFAADQSKNWFKFNDSLVTDSKPQEMHSLTSPNTPYILFYQMCGRSTDSDSSANGLMHPMVPLPQIPPLKLDELPRKLRDYVNQDNREYTEELKSQHFKQQAKRNNNNSTVSDNGTMTRNGYEGDDEDDQTPPPTGGCGGNDLSMNFNRFVY